MGDNIITTTNNIYQRQLIDDKIYNEHDIMNGGKLVSEGGFGCVFYPGIECSGEISDNVKIVSKIQVADKNSENEIKVGQIIKKIHGFTNNFSPVVSDCPIEINKLEDPNKSKCGIFKKYKKTNFHLMKMVYIKGDPFTLYMMNIKNKTELINNLINSYNHLLKSISKLIHNKVVHFDLKGNNILFNSIMKEPVIIDFGLSIAIEELENVDNKKLKEYFYIYAPDYYIWTLEVHYLCYLIHENPSPDDKELLDICYKYVKHNHVFLKLYSKDFLKQYIKSCFKQLKKYNNMEKNKRIMFILNTWSTWDNYALSLLFSIL